MRHQEFEHAESEPWSEQRRLGTLAHAQPPSDGTVLHDRATQRCEADESDASRKSKRVLVVDDSPAIRELGRDLLSGRGYDVEIAVDGIDAWNAIRAGNFDLVLTDIDMPLIDGFRLTRLIRGDPRFESMSVLIACDQDRETDQRRGFEAGADYYVIKSCFQHTLAQVVASLIGAPQ